MNVKYLLVFLTSCLMTSCSFVSVDNKTRYRDAEGYFDPALLQQIQAGETTAAWLHKHFGRPWSSENGLAEEYLANVQLSTWRFERERQKNTRVFLLFRSRNLSEQNEYLHVVTEDHIVVRAWRDELESVDVRRIMASLGYERFPPPATKPVDPQPTAAPVPSREEVPSPAPTAGEHRSGREAFGPANSGYSI